MGLFELFPDNPDDPAATGSSNLRASLDRVRQTHQADTMPVQKYDIRGPDGSFTSRYWSPKNLPVLSPSGKVVYIPHQVEEVTELVRASEAGEELRGRSRDMEREVIRRSEELAVAMRELRDANARLAEADAAKTAFFSNISHEFRTPLTLMLGPLEDALAETESEPARHQRLETIHRNALRLLKLVNTLLDFARIEAGRVAAAAAGAAGHRGCGGHRRAAARVLPAARDAGRARAGEPQTRWSGRWWISRAPAGATCHSSAASWSSRARSSRPNCGRVMGSGSELREALTNLVFNAVDAMPEGGTITLRTVADAHSIVLEVADTGIGMNDETSRRCLEPFFTTKGERGTGLGLAMVYGIVKRHAADIRIVSAPGEGTAIRIVFPRPEQTKNAPTAHSVQVLPPDLHLLLIDDDPHLLKPLREILELEGHRITTASDGAAGIEAFREAIGNDPFDLVITDLGMPRMDGRAVAWSIKEISPTTPIVLLTGWGQRPDASGEVLPHIDRVLGKPPKLQDLRKALAQLCAPGKAGAVSRTLRAIKSGRQLLAGRKVGVEPAGRSRLHALLRSLGEDRRGTRLQGDLQLSFLPVHVAVGAQQQRLGITTIERIDREAGAGAEPYGFAADDERLPRHLLYLFQYAGDVAERAHVGDQQHELVAAIAREHVLSAHAALEAMAERAQQLVRRLVAARIVDELEVVEIEEQHADEVLPGFGGLKGFAQGFHQPRAVGQAGQRIVGGLVAQLVLDLLHLAHVPGNAGKKRRFPAVRPPAVGSFHMMCHQDLRNRHLGLGAVEQHHFAAPDSTRESGGDALTDKLGAGSRGIEVVHREREDAVVRSDAEHPATHAVHVQQAATTAPYHHQSWCCIHQFEQAATQQGNLMGIHAVGVEQLARWRERRRPAFSLDRHP